MGVSTHAGFPWFLVSPLILGLHFLSKPLAATGAKVRGPLVYPSPAHGRYHRAALQTQLRTQRSDAPSDGHTQINVGLETVTFCPQILKIMLYHCLYNPVSPVLMTTSSSNSARPSCTQTLHEKELLTTCCSRFTFTKNPCVLSLQLGCHIWSPQI